VPQDVINVGSLLAYGTRTYNILVTRHWL